MFDYSWLSTLYAKKLAFNLETRVDCPLFRLVLDEWDYSAHCFHFSRTHNSSIVGSYQGAVGAAREGVKGQV